MKPVSFSEAIMHGIEVFEIGMGDKISEAEQGRFDRPIDRIRLARFAKLKVPNRDNDICSRDRDIRGPPRVHRVKTKQSL